MKADTLQKAVELGKKLGQIFVATADGRGMPHLAAAGDIDMSPGGYVSVSAWFCPGTLNNLEQNRKISLVVWDPDTDIGYQILGEVTAVVDHSYLNGYGSQIKERTPLPQVERKLTVLAESVLTFSHAPHSDVEE